MFILNPHGTCGQGVAAPLHLGGVMRRRGLRLGKRRGDADRGTRSALDSDRDSFIAFLKSNRRRHVLRSAYITYNIILYELHVGINDTCVRARC